MGADRLRAVELLTVIIDGSLASGDVTGARAACDDLHDRLEDVGIAAVTARGDAAQAAVLAAEGDPVTAVALLRVAIERVDPAALPWRRALLLVDLSHLLSEAGDHSAAREEARNALGCLEALDVVLPLRARSLVESSVSDTRPGRPSVAALALGEKWWTASFHDTSVVLPKTKGLAYVAVLIASTGVERHVLDLVDRVEGVGVAGDPDRRSLGDAGPLLDVAARSAYRRRIETIRGDIDDALAAHALDHAESLQAELDQLVTQLAAAFGIGGADRVAGSATERARINVTRAIRTAVNTLGTTLPEAGASLDRRIRTGRYCAYVPEAEDQIHWIVQS
jgi:hypothetical protein